MNRRRLWRVRVARKRFGGRRQVMVEQAGIKGRWRSITRGVETVSDARDLSLDEAMHAE